MKKGLFILLAIVVVGCTAPHVDVTIGTAPKTIDDIIQDGIDRTFQIKISGDSPFCRGSGSGFILGPQVDGGTLVGSVQHVAHDPACTYTAKGNPLVNGHKLYLLAVSMTHDAALLYLDQPTDFPMLRESPGTLGTGVINIGFPWQLATEKTQLQVSRGSLIAKYSDWNGEDSWRTSASSGPGGSGGLVIDEQGRLVGMHKASYRFSPWPYNASQVPVWDQSLLTPAKHLFRLVSFHE